MVSRLNLHTDMCPGTMNVLPMMHQMLITDPDLLEKPQTNGILPLHNACKALHLNCVKFLLKSGANPCSVCPTTSNNAIFYTLLSQYRRLKDPRLLEIVQLLIAHRKNGEKIYKHEENFKSDFLSIIEYCFNSILKVLLENGEVINNILPENDVPKIYSLCYGFVSKAILARNLEAVKVLILHGNCFSNYIFKNRKFTGTPTKIVKIYKNYCIPPLRIFYNFGGNLKTKHQSSGVEKVPKTVLEFLQDSPNLIDVCIVNEIQEMSDKPLCLKAQSRLALWRHLGIDYWWKIKCLELPDELVRYLELNDL